MGPAERANGSRCACCGPGLGVVLEDTDPFRDCYEWPAAPGSLPSSSIGGSGLPGGLAGDRAGARNLRRGTRCGALHPHALGGGRRPPPGASSRNAFGAIAAALPGEASDLARLLLSEFQSMKLGALLDLCDLYDPGDNRLFPVQWGESKQQLREASRGAYMGLASSDFWRVRRQVTAGSASEMAGQRFMQSRARTREAIDTLLGSGSLTSVGSILRTGDAPVDLCVAGRPGAHAARRPRPAPAIRRLALRPAHAYRNSGIPPGNLQKSLIS